MPATQQLQIRSAIAAVLTAAAVLPANRIQEGRDLQLATGVESQLRVRLTDSAPEDGVMFANHPISWKSGYELQVLARRSAVGTEASDVADAVWMAAYAALMASQTLGGLADYLEPGDMSVEYAEGDTSIARLTWSITVHHRTANNVLT